MMRVIDIGNTNTKISDLKSDGTKASIIDIKIFSTKKLSNINKYIIPQRTIISSVTNTNPSHTGVLIFNSKTKVPIKKKYKTPATLGNDRLANAVGAWYFNPNKHHLIIDVGTCLKFDFVTKKGEYLGGSISPGLQMRYMALHHFTDKLPLLKPVKKAHYLGDSTNTCIHAGVIEGMVGEIKTVIKRYKKDFGKINIHLTGGDTMFFEKQLKNNIFADPFLTIKGLYAILLYNIE